LIAGRRSVTSSTSCRGARIRSWQIRGERRCDGLSRGAADAGTSPDARQIELHNPVDLPDPVKIATIEEPWIRATILTPDDYLGSCGPAARSVADAIIAARSLDISDLSRQVARGRRGRHPSTRLCARSFPRPRPGTAASTADPRPPSQAVLSAIERMFVRHGLSTPASEMESG
jgi:hypothetical protein